MRPPAYRDRLTTGIVHFGPGAFHRAHQADYIHRLSRNDPRWGIAAVSMRSAGTIDGLRRQDGLYTLAVLDRETSFETIGVHNRFFGPGDLDVLKTLFLDPSIRVVTSTVTEKGYCLAPDGSLDLNHPDVRHDLDDFDAPKSLVGWLALALSIRRNENLPPLTVICCDNMVSNGRKLGCAVAQFAGSVDIELRRWIEGEIRFPNTMVDSITPASDTTLRRLVRDQTGFDDSIPVRREAYTEWVIEDVLPPGIPELKSAGATLTGDVAGWEKAKLRILNGAHSSLAYLGLLIGHETVYDAMRDKDLAGFVERLIARDIIPSLLPSPLDLQKYAAETLQRFRNPSIDHKLSQIAWDGSQKLPYRLLDTILDALVAGRPLEQLAVPVAGWILFLQRQFRADVDVVDPLVLELRNAATTDDPVRSILDLRRIFPERLSGGSEFGCLVSRAYSTMQSTGTREFLSAEAAHV